jgi:quercetin dioxygenase-like cupin family protein
MAHEVFEDLKSAIAVQPGAVVSRVIHREARCEVTLFAFDEGEGLTEHTSGRTAIIQLISGEMRITAGGDERIATAGFWLRMDPGTSHELRAEAPSVMLLTLLDTA